MIYKDDFLLHKCEDNGIVPARAWFMSYRFELLRKDSDRLVNLPEKRIILTTDIEWPIVKEEL